MLIEECFQEQLNEKRAEEKKRSSRSCVCFFLLLDSRMRKTSNHKPAHSTAFRVSHCAPLLFFEKYIYIGEGKENERGEENTIIKVWKGLFRSTTKISNYLRFHASLNLKMTERVFSSSTDDCLLCQ